MKVEAHDILIENLFKKGRFVIPDYQREFGWDDENIDELLEDIDETPVSENYFIGHMVFEGDFNGFEYKVVDGQQRLTTLTIILCAIRDRFIEIGEENLGEAIHISYIFGKDKNYKDFVVLENKMPYPVLQSYVQNKPKDKNTEIKPIKSGEKKIIHGYNKIKKYLESFDREGLIVLRDKILKLEVIFVATSDQVDASAIFMTLNATGKDLSPLDLVKNHIFSLYPKLIHIDEPNDSWKSIIDNTNGSVKFLNNFFASRYKKVSDTKIFKEFLKIIKKEGKENIKEFLANLKDDALIYRYISKPKQEDWNKNDYVIFESIYALTSIFKIGVANSWLISLIREYKSQRISKDYILKALNCIERFHFINNAICSNRSSGFDTMYAKKSRQLFDATDREKKHRRINELVAELEKKTPTLETFNAYFDRKLFYSSKQQKQKHLVQYALNKIERKLQPNSLLLNTSIEHIYPENNENWSQISDKNLIQNIGNLVLLDASLNSKIGNKLYSYKKERILKDSKLFSTQQVFSGHDIWTENEILERKNSLIQELYTSVWKA